jgi:hypothetical protein
LEYARYVISSACLPQVQGKSLSKVIVDYGQQSHHGKLFTKNKCTTFIEKCLIKSSVTRPFHPTKPSP